jgi:ferredoxin
MQRTKPLTTKDHEGFRFQLFPSCTFVALVVNDFANCTTTAKNETMKIPRIYAILTGMPADVDPVKPAGMVPEEFKFEPKSKGILTPRKKKPKELAVITECCTGCAGSPACVEYCPVEDCMFWVPDEDSPPFGRIQVDPILCIGCKKCISKGPDGCFLDGCPWDAIVMVDTIEVEKEVGVMPI